MYVRQRASLPTTAVSTSRNPRAREASGPGSAWVMGAILLICPAEGMAPMTPADCSPATPVPTPRTPRAREAWGQGWAGVVGAFLWFGPEEARPPRPQAD